MNSYSWRAWAAPLGFLMAAVVCGCTGSVKPPATVEVSGKVTYNGKPVTGGMVSFVALKGGFSGSGRIDENGDYKATAVPVGEVKITIDNSMLQKGRGVPRSGPMLKNPNAEQPSEMKGKYIELPSKYASTDQTDLTYTVTPGSQTHDIDLK